MCRILKHFGLISSVALRYFDWQKIMRTKIPQHVVIFSREMTFPRVQTSFQGWFFPRCSMYGIFTYIYPKNCPNVGKYIPYMEHLGFVCCHFDFDPNHVNTLEISRSILGWVGVGATGFLENRCREDQLSLKDRYLTFVFTLNAGIQLKKED